MIPHANLTMELSNRPLPPPPPPGTKDSSFSPAISTSSPSNTTSPRIRRKPLPSTAFSPKSVISSPISVRSETESPNRAVTPHSGVILKEVLISPPRRTDSLAHKPRYTDDSPTVQLASTTVHPRAIEEASIPNFPPPPPPPRNASLPDRLNEDSYTSLTREENMAVKSTERPPPLRMESLKAVKAMDAKKPQSPGSVFTSFFSRKLTASPQNVSPGAESSATDISDTQSPYLPPGSAEEGSYFAPARPSASPLQRQSSWQSSQSSISYSAPQRMNSGASGSIGPTSSDAASRCNMLEAELKDISRELAGSIRRELDLEDLVDRLQTEAPRAPMSVDRTSDYFSDSGTSSVRHPGHDFNSKEEMDKIRRESEQQRARLKIELSQKWQNEVTQRKNLEAHVQILESKLSQTRQTTNETSDASARIRELEVLLDDSRRRLVEERQTKENFEDLLTALRVELELHRNERDNLRDEVVPKLKSQLDGLESTFGDTQKQAYDFARMQQEIQSLKDENAAISSARKMEQELMRSGMHYVPEDESAASHRLSLVVPKPIGLNRSSTVSNRTMGPHSAPLSRPVSILSRQLPDTPESMADKLNAIEQQRDALHSAVKYLKTRYYQSTETYEKKIRNLHKQMDKLSRLSGDSRRGGYENEVRTMRQEINLLRRRADDALDQKWQCEKGLAGLKMDLDRSKQETASLQKLLQARDSDDPELLSAALESAMTDLQQTRARGHETVAALQYELDISRQLEESAERAEVLATQVRRQLEANASLRSRLKNAVASGEQNQHTSAVQIGNMQSKLKKLEDILTTNQIQSETAVMKHEEEIRNLKASHNAQLMRAKAGIKSPGIGPPQPSPLSPMFAVKSPRLDNTSSGPGMTLNQALKTEPLQKKVAELEKALSDAEHEMGEVVGRMNQAQIEVFELQQERDEAHKQTRRLELDIKAERERFQALVTGSMNS